MRGRLKLISGIGNTREGQDGGHHRERLGERPSRCEE